MQIADVTGVYGIGFVLAAVNAALEGVPLLDWTGYKRRVQGESGWRRTFSDGRLGERSSCCCS
jgi:hypothetical protein